MNTVSKIEEQLRARPGFNLRQTFGYPFKDFKISGVGAKFEQLIGKDPEYFLPEFDILYKNYIGENRSQFDWETLSENDVKGRVARMWASLVREWHAFYSVQEFFVENGFTRENVTRNDFLDTFKGIDIYIKNEDNPGKSLKIDILMDSKNSLDYRDTKDLYRQKGSDIPGEAYRIYLGPKFPDNTKKIPDKEGAVWFLISDLAVEKIYNRYSGVSAD